MATPRNTQYVSTCNERKIERERERESDVDAGDVGSVLVVAS